jgi:hypothetical protein
MQGRWFMRTEITKNVGKHRQGRARRCNSAETVRLDRGNLGCGEPTRLESVGGGVKASLAIRAAMGRGQMRRSSEIEKIPTSEQNS